MAKFRFRLATLLRLREATRDQRRAELAEAYRVDEMLQEQLREVDGAFGALRDACRKAVGPGPVDIDGLLVAQRYELSLKARQRQIVEQRAAVAGEIERRREALVAANREVRVLENLRDKQAQRHRQEENRREIKFLDEVAQQRAVREVTA